jgi:uncharacterized protein (UPF0371 family)
MKEPGQQLEEEIVVARGGSDHKEETRARVIRIRQETYDRLKKRGEFGMDFDDVVTRVLDDLEKCEKEHRKK